MEPEAKLSNIYVLEYVGQSSIQRISVTLVRHFANRYVLFIKEIIGVNLTYWTWMLMKRWQNGTKLD